MVTPHRLFLDFIHLPSNRLLLDECDEMIFIGNPSVMQYKMRLLLYKKGCGLSSFEKMFFNELISKKSLLGIKYFHPLSESSHHLCQHRRSGKSKKTLFVCISTGCFLLVLPQKFQLVL